MENLGVDAQEDLGLDRDVGCLKAWCIANFKKRLHWKLWALVHWVLGDGDNNINQNLKLSFQTHLVH